jgi:FtsH-binding integral membrane protein
MRIAIAFYQLLCTFFTLILLALILSSPHVHIGVQTIPAFLAAFIPLVICVFWAEGLRQRQVVRVSLLILHTVFFVGLIFALVFLTKQASPGSILEYAYLSTLGLLTVVLGVYLIRKDLFKFGGTG